MSAPALDLCLDISLAHARLQLALDDALGTWHGIGHADFILLHTLAQAEGGRLRTAALVAPLGVPVSAVVRRLIPLEKTGHIARDAGHVSLRPAGLAVLAEARTTASALCADALQGLPAGATDAAAALLHHLAPTTSVGAA
ncbi:AsnC family transcriptional regulator [Simplicispira lacusdiani]|uniref:AsnC family transcriptional regulator n=1 Tax=Simplicispira lacusdiani TaxID=2213010 RepID=UPI000E747D30|nr:AsnC family transcriptional regulator [Simplicispira lacusdiani]